MDEMFIDDLEEGTDYEDREQTDYYCTHKFEQL